MGMFKLAFHFFFIIILFFIFPRHALYGKCNRLTGDKKTFFSVLATPEVLPGFWIFMYRVSPFTYFVSAVLSTGLSGTAMECSSIELLHIPPPAGQNCSSYLDRYAKAAGSRVINPSATTDCQMCAMSQTDQFLAMIGIYYADLWRNVGVLFVFVVFNAAAAVFLYWLMRVPKRRRDRKSTTE